MGNFDALNPHLGLCLLYLGGILVGCAPPAPTQTNATTQTKMPPAAADGGVRVADGKPFRLADIDRSRGACLFFVGTDCPISNAYAPEMGRIITEFAPHGVSFYLIYSLRELALDQAAEHAKSFGLPGVVILDSQLHLAQALSATRMPEVILLPAHGDAVYQGRIDDRYPAPGAKRREHPTTHDLRDALAAFVAGKPIQRPRTPAVGCHLDLPQ